MIFEMSDGPKWEVNDLFASQHHVDTFLVTAFLCLSLLPFATLWIRWVLAHAVLKFPHRLAEIVFSKFSLLVDDQKDAVTASRKKVVLKWGRSEISVNNVTGLFMGFAYPFGELHSVWYGGGEEDISDGMRKEDDSLLPNHSTFFVPHVMDFIEYHPGNFSHDFGTSV